LLLERTYAHPCATVKVLAARPSGALDRGLLEILLASLSNVASPLPLPRPRTGGKG